MEEVRRKYKLICSSFQKKPDGSWTCIKSIKIDIPGVAMEIEEGTTFTRGQKYQDIDMAEWLSEICSEMTFGPI